MSRIITEGGLIFSFFYTRLLSAHLLGACPSQNWGWGGELLFSTKVLYICWGGGGGGEASAANCGREVRPLQQTVSEDRGSGVRPLQPTVAENPANPAFAADNG
jgi:hypothetical protein